MTGSPLDSEIVRYLADRQRLREQRTEDVLDRLTPFEFRLATEMAVMGWVQGFMHAQSGAASVGDFPKLPIVVANCLSMSNLYPITAALDDGFRPEDDGFAAAFRRHSGVDEEENE